MVPLEILTIPLIFDTICTSSELTNCALFMVSIVAIKLLFHCLFKFSKISFVANLIVVSICSVPNVMGVWWVCALSGTINKRTSLPKAQIPGILR